MMLKKDWQLLQELRENAKTSTLELARKVGLPATTVHNHIKRLEKEGYIKKYSAILDAEKLGRPVLAYILVNVNYGELKAKHLSQYDLVKKVRAKFEAVEEASMITGQYDILFKVRFESIQQINEFVTKELRSLDGVEKTQTLIAFNEV